MQNVQNECSMKNSHRIPPQNLEAEQSVLGACLLNKELALIAIDRLKSDDFYKEVHKIIFEYIIHLHQINENIDLVTVCEWIRKDEKLDQVGGLSYVSSLTDIMPTTSATKTHCRIIKNKSDLRSLIRVSTDVAESCYHDADYKNLFERIEKTVFNISTENAGGRFKRVSSLVDKVFKDIEEISDGKKKSFGIPTGYQMIDKMTGGFCPEDFIIIAGRPSMGKTSLAMNIIENMTLAGENAAIFSLEMGGASLVLRLMASIGRLDSFRLKNGKINDEDWPKLTRASGVLGELGIFIDDSSSLSPYEIRSRGRRVKKEHNVSSIWIDYLQLSDVGSRSREEEVRIISKECKAMAKELEIPVIAVSQLNRACEQRTDKRPLLSDLRDSGSIEQDADVVAFVYRDEVYNDSEDNPKKGLAEFIIRKNRNGPIGTAELVWLDSYTRFENKAY